MDDSNNYAKMKIIYQILDIIWYCFTAGIFIALLGCAWIIGLGLTYGAQRLWELWTDGKHIADR